MTAAAADIFRSLWYDGIRLRREGDQLAFKSAAGRPATVEQIEQMKAHKAELLALVDGAEPVVVDDGQLYIVANPPDLRRLCQSMAKARGFPPLQLEALLIPLGPSPWMRFAVNGTEEQTCEALLMLDDVPVLEVDDL